MSKSDREIHLHYRVRPREGDSAMAHLLLGSAGSKRTSDQGRRREGLFRAIFDLAAAGIAQVGPDGRWLLVNKKLCEILGYPPEEYRAVGQDATAYPREADHEPFIEASLYL